MPTRKHRINLTVSDELYEKISKNASRQGLSRSTYCLSFLSNYMDIQEQLMAATKNSIKNYVSENVNCHDEKETD